MKVYLNYPKKIFCREKEGLSSLYKFSKNNIERAYDIVLQGQEYDLSNIYIKKAILKKYKNRIQFSGYNSKYKSY